MVRSNDTALVKEGDCLEMVNMRLHEGALEVMPRPLPLMNFYYRYRLMARHLLSGYYLAVTDDEQRAVHLVQSDFSQSFLYTRGSEPQGVTFHFTCCNISRSFVMPAGSAGEHFVYNNVSGLLTLEGSEVPTVISHAGEPLPFAPQLLDDSATGVERIEFMDNLVCLFTSATLLFALYDNGAFRWLGSKPQLPQLTLSLATKWQQLTTQEAYYTGYSTSDERELFWDNVSKGYFDECISQLNADGYFVDYTLVRCALRLYDGSYIAHSPVYLVRDPGNDIATREVTTNFLSSATSGEASRTTRSTFVCRVRGIKPSFNFEDFDLEAWKNLVVSLDLFATPSIMGHKAVDDYYTTYAGRSQATSANPSTENNTGEKYSRYISKSAGELWHDVSDASLFYRIAEYDLTGRLTASRKDVSADALALGESLPDDGGSHLTYTSACSTVYNNRLHLGGVTATLFGGYGADYLLPAGEGWPTSGIVWQARLYVYVQTPQGTSIVGRSFTGGKFPASRLTPLLQYPDNRAYKMVLQFSRDGLAWYSRTFPLTPHKYLNMAFYLNGSTQGIYETYVTLHSSNVTAVTVDAATFATAVSQKEGTYTFFYDADTASWVLNGVMAGLDTYGIVLRESDVPAADDNFTVSLTLIDNAGNGIAPISLSSFAQGSGTIAVQNTQEQRPAVVKVSALDNPFSFPAAHTYCPSRSPVLALCSNTVALSQGQFGQHPLYVFTQEGIWALTVDTTGQGSYAACVPVSRDVCNGTTAVCPLDNGVAFLSSKGVMLLNGTRVKEVSAQLDGPMQPAIGVNEYIRYNGANFYRYAAGDKTVGSFYYYAWKSAGSLVRYTRLGNPCEGDAVYSVPGSTSTSGRVTEWRLDATDRLGSLACRAGFGTMVSRETFKEYCRGASVGFCYNRSQLVVAHRGYPFVYVYGLNSNQWCKQSYRVNAFVNTYPGLMALVGEREGVQLCNIDTTALSPSRFWVVTRPLSLGAIGYKKLFFSALRGVLSPAGSPLSIAVNNSQHRLCLRDDSLQLYGSMGYALLGSNDACHFTQLLLREVTATQRDIVCALHAVAGYKYYVLTLWGTATADTRIDGVRMIVQERWNNQLR